MNNVEYIEIEKLKPFENHPYKVKNDEEMENLIESIREHGILTPIIVRPIENNEYEIISGHRRLFAGKRAGLLKIPALVAEMDRDTAAITLVDSNLHRENILPSEKAFAYKLKMEALSHQGKRTDLTSAQVEPKLSAEVIGEKENVSRETVKRYIRLTNLLPKLLELADDGRIAFTPAVELSYLNDIEQQDLLEIIESEYCTPSLSQAVRMKKPTKRNALKSQQNEYGNIFQRILQIHRLRPLLYAYARITIRNSKSVILPKGKVDLYDKTNKYFIRCFFTNI